MPEPRSLVDNAGSERQVRNAERIERDRARQFDADLKDILDTDAGIRVWCSLMERCSAWRSVLAEKPHVMHFNAGKRDVGIMLYDLASNAEAMPRIAAEHARRQKNVPQEIEDDE
jgi:hypothetical protein